MANSTELELNESKARIVGKDGSAYLIVDGQQYQGFDVAWLLDNAEGVLSEPRYLLTWIAMMQFEEYVGTQAVLAPMLRRVRVRSKLDFLALMPKVTEKEEEA